MSWYNEQGEQDGIIICSRVRLARNLRQYPFPHKLDEASAKKVVQDVKTASAATLQDSFNFIDISQTPSANLHQLMEQRFISPKMVKHPQKSALLMSKDEYASVMINEEDHIRIQTLFAGSRLENAYNMADFIDNKLSEKIEFGFSDKFGFLTCCPTNLGTGLRASAMLHLPALTISGQINELLAAVGRLGIAVRGVYGEGSSPEGNIYQVSNQVTLGLSEDETIRKFNDVVQRIVEKERQLEKAMYAANTLKISDNISRSYGVLKYAKMLSVSEIAKLISDMRLGAVLGLINIPHEQLNQIMITTLPAHIAEQCEGNSKTEHEMKRAEIVQKML